MNLTISSPSTTNTKPRNHKNFAKKKRKQFSKKRKTAAKQQAKRRAITNRYLCTVCGSQVFKKRASSPVPTKEDPDKKTGLGKWRCKCGNKKVRREAIVETPNTGVAA